MTCSHVGQGAPTPTLILYADKNVGVRVPRPTRITALYMHSQVQRGNASGIEDNLC